MQDKTWYAVSPGTMGLCALAINLLGIENVGPGDWMSPVFVNASEQDVRALVELADEAVKGKLMHRYAHQPILGRLWGSST